MIDESERARFAESVRDGEMIDELTRERDAEVARLNVEIARLTGELRHGATVRGRPGTMWAGVLGWMKDSDPFWDVISEGRCAFRCLKPHVLDDWEVINPAQYIEQLTRERDEARAEVARLTREALENDVVGAETALHFCRGMSEEADAQKALDEARARLAAFNLGESPNPKETA